MFKHREPNLDYDRMAKRVADPDDGGFSYNAEGHRPRSGIMVARAGSEQVVEGHATPDDIRNFVKHNVRHLNGPDVFVGGWHDEGKTYLDVSDRFPHGHQQAEHALSANAQIAGYDVTHGSFPPGNPTLFPLEPNVPPVRPARSRAQKRNPQYTTPPML